MPALAARGAAAGDAVRAQEWWLAGLHVTQAWQASEGAGVTVAVLGTGVAAAHPDLAADVITGPDYSGSGRTPGGPFWGADGTAVAGIIAGHGHGTGGASGVIGIAPAAKILSVRVSLEFNDPLNSDRAITRRLPDAIADGIIYAADHGARVIDLPLDPGTLGLTGRGDPAAAGGSPGEQAAVAYALRKNVVLVAPAGDDGQGPGIVNYPAAYPGVIAVGAVGRNGRLASFSSRRPYTLLTAPGVDLVAAAPSGGYAQISSTSMASGIVAGVAALIVSKFPRLTVAQVTRALTESTVPAADGTAAVADGAAAAGGVIDAAKADGLPPLPARSADGAGYGIVDAARAVESAAVITTADRAVTQPARPRKLGRRPVASPRQPSASALAGSLLRDVVAGLGALIVLLVVVLLVMRSRRGRGQPEGTGPGRARTRGAHEHRRPDRVPVTTMPDRDAAVASLPKMAEPASPAAEGWPSFASWQGGGIGQIARSPSAPFRPFMSSAPRGTGGSRSNRGAVAGGSAGPPWEPAPEPGRSIGPLPAASPGSPPPEVRPSIRVPGDMAAPAAPAAPPAAPAGLQSPVAFDFGIPLGRPDFAAPPLPPDLAAPPLPPDLAAPPVPPDLAAPPLPPDLAAPAVPAGSGPAVAGSDLPARESLGFAAAPVPTDYAAPPAGPSYIWDLAATDVFPVAPGPGTPAETAGPPDAGPPEEASGAGG